MVFFDDYAAIETRHIPNCMEMHFEARVVDKHTWETRKSVHYHLLIDGTTPNVTVMLTKE